VFFFAALGWNFGLGMTWLVVPLYAHSQGLSSAEIGVLFGVPVFAQAPLNLMGGAYADRVGARRIMLGACWATAAAGLWFIFAQGFWMLLVGQLALIVSRATFWPATWAIATELPGKRETQVGRLNAVSNTGQILGSVLCGFSLAALGFPATFAALAAMGLISVLAGLLTRSDPPRERRSASLLASYWPLLQHRIIQYSVMCAYLSALPYSVSISFLPLLLARFGYTEQSSGFLLALQAVGAITASLLAPRFVRSGPQTVWPVVCGVVVAASIGFLPVWNHVAPIAFSLLLVGASSAAMILYFQITIAQASRPEERGSAVALGGLGWSISHFSTPLIMGALADRYGLVTGFYVIGIVALACALTIAWARRWAFQVRSPAIKS
jgi:predicted MFS family arabinose efflux permease